MANISGATIVASDSITNIGVSTASLPQVIFSVGLAPAFEFRSASDKPNSAVFIAPAGGPIAVVQPGSVLAMRDSGTPAVKDLVLVGGGHSHVTVLRSFGMQPLAGVRLTLVCRDMHAPYSGMLPGLIAGHYEFDDAHIDLAPLARFAGARFVHDEVVGLDLSGRRVLCANHPPLRYDVLSINIGSSPRTAGVPGARELAVPVKPIDGFSARWEAMRPRLLQRTEPTVVAVVGGGAGGVELLLAVQYRLRKDLAALGRDDRTLRFRLYTKTSQVLPGHNRSVQRRFRRVLRQRGVQVRAGRKVVRVTRNGTLSLHLDDGSCEPADEVLWVTTAGAQDWPARAGLEVDAGGFIRVHPTLQTLTDPCVFAVGDVAAVDGYPRPKAGVFAVRQGAPLAENLRRVLRGEGPRPYRPQRQFLSLISTGDRYAVASRSFWAAEGTWVWRWKDWIDRRFMRRFNELPEMQVKPSVPRADVTDERALARIQRAPMRCGGCGSKVGARVLESVLAQIHPVVRDDLAVGLQAPDDAAVITPVAGAQMVLSVDHFRSFIDDPFVFGQVTANHALGDIWAMGAEPQSALAIVTVPFAGEAQMQQDILQMLAGASSVFREAGVSLAGGHTGEGQEMALGFSLTGWVQPEQLLRKSGLRHGDVLLLTKPVGTGVLFAAAMRGLAKGRWLEQAIRWMRMSSARAAACLRHHGATAMTDVTGFGLLGHLLEMTRASKLGAELELDQVPVLDGALQLTRHGVFSSLQPENLRLRRAIQNLKQAAQSPKYPLLYDPQTAGGLLAGVPAERAGACAAELRAAGYEAARIGTVTRPGGSTPIRVHC